MEPRRYSDFEIYRRLLKQARPLVPLLGALFLLQILATPLTLLTPLPLKIAVDRRSAASMVP
jgi:ATP-binding cassette subfamily B protein